MSEIITNLKISPRTLNTEENNIKLCEQLENGEDKSKHLCNKCGIDTFMSCPKVNVSGHTDLDLFPFVDYGYSYYIKDRTTQIVGDERKSYYLQKCIVSECSRYKPEKK